MDHAQRRRLLHRTVAHLEPGACLTAIREHVARRHGLDVPLLRLSVDLERMVADGRLTRRLGPHPSGTGTAFFYETFGAVLVEPSRPRAKAGTAGAPLAHVPPEAPAPQRAVLELAF